MLLTLAGAVEGGSLFVACSSSVPPVSGIGSQGMLDSGGAPLADSGPPQPKPDGGNPVDFDATAGDGAGGPDATGGDSAADMVDSANQPIDVASLPDVRSLDAYAPCGFLTCQGCCESDGGCVPGLDSIACGGSGNTCLDCTLTSQTCNAATAACQ
jgi:hypothetical protein